ncbi:MAG TPA: phage tail sheath subtilisin-like domain-containing protein [Rhodocyclaceae bacterium]|nr:phage tail sheath subtilisin-like domain-containing protein [Rhodocyclaceae bacterium]HNF61597.1 phage tail sheath subtilisin-like domain-containing protein [Rhodocyclaceae bacterium]
MPEYLAPGVFIEETSFRQKSIEGVGTSVAALVGPTRSGPLRGTPEALTSYAEFERTFGDAEDLKLGGSATLNLTSHAARAFFDNGGKQLFVVRVAAGGNDSDATSTGSSATAASVADSKGNLAFKSRFPGAQGNLTLEILWRDTENLLASETVASAADGVQYYLDARGVVEAAKVTGAITSDKFPVDIQAIVQKDGANLRIPDARATLVSKADPANPAPVGANQITVLDPTKLPAGTQLRRVYARQPSAGALSADALAVLTLKAEADLSAFTKGDHWAKALVLRGTLDKGGQTFTVKGDATLNPGITKDVSVPLAALASVPGAAGALVVQRSFDLEVRNGGPDGEILYVYGSLDFTASGDRSLAKALPAAPERKEDALHSPVACTVKTLDGAALASTLYTLFTPAALFPPAGSYKDPRYLITLSGGTDGNVPGAGDYAGETNELLGSTGLAALEAVEDVSIVMVPAAAAHADTHTAVLMEMLKHCRRMRYRVGLVDSREGMSLGEVRTFRNDFDDSRLALYHPWVTIADPTGQRREITVPPAGFIAGVYARTDVDRGVHKAPANETVLGALSFEQDINQFQQELLNPNGINCLRAFPGRGLRVWGGRTLSSDPEWKYVNVRRYFLYLERSIEKSTQWAVFEPNGEALWANIRSSVEDFLFNEWKNGRLLGGAPKEAYFVRCDRSTMTQNDLDNGRLVCVVGVAPLRPAEFVIFRIGQKTADA